MLTLTAYPPEGPYERWELTDPAGTVLLAGPVPVDEPAVREACRAWWAKQEAERLETKP